MELGVIGATYEDRRNGRIGKLLSRDDKCKTLMFEIPGGKTFMMSYSGFRSNMRKREAVEEVSVEPSNVQENVPKETEKKEKVSNNPYPTKLDMYNDVLSKLANYVDSFKNKRVKILAKPDKMLAHIKVDRHYNVLDIYILWNTMQFKAYIKEDTYLKTPWTVQFESVYKHVTYPKPICVYLSYNDLEQFLEDFRQEIVDKLVDEKDRRNMKEELK